MTPPTTLEVALRLVGASLLVLALLHGVFWRTLGWNQEVQALTPLTRRVFWAHTGVTAGALGGLGLLSLLHPSLLVVPSDLARLLLVGIVCLWSARMLAQPLLFAPVMLQGWPRLWGTRYGTTFLWLAYLLIYGWALLQQLGGIEVLDSAPWPPANSPVFWMRVAVAAVWLTFGLGFKLLNLVPRHQAIVARVVGHAWARILTPFVALGEMGLGVWMLWGRQGILCMVVQTAGIVSMNTLEWTYARDLLLAPRTMLAANAVLLGVGWCVVLSAV